MADKTATVDQSKLAPGNGIGGGFVSGEQAGLAAGQAQLKKKLSPASYTSRGNVRKYSGIVDNSWNGEAMQKVDITRFSDYDAKNKTPYQLALEMAGKRQQLLAGTHAEAQTVTGPETAVPANVKPTAAPQPTAEPQPTTTTQPEVTAQETAPKTPYQEALEAAQPTNIMTLPADLGRNAKEYYGRDELPTGLDATTGAAPTLNNYTTPQQTQVQQKAQQEEPYFYQRVMDFFNGDRMNAPAGPQGELLRQSMQAMQNRGKQTQEVQPQVEQQPEQEPETKTEAAWAPTRQANVPGTYATDLFTLPTEYRRTVQPEAVQEETEQKETTAYQNALDAALGEQTTAAERPEQTVQTAQHAEAKSDWSMPINAPAAPTMDNPMASYARDLLSGTNNHQGQLDAALEQKAIDEMYTEKPITAERFMDSPEYEKIAGYDGAADNPLGEMFQAEAVAKAQTAYDERRTAEITETVRQNTEGQYAAWMKVNHIDEQTLTEEAGREFDAWMEKEGINAESIRLEARREFESMLTEAGIPPSEWGQYTTQLNQYIRDYMGLTAQFYAEQRQTFVTESVQQQMTYYGEQGQKLVEQALAATDIPAMLELEHQNAGDRVVKTVAGTAQKDAGNYQVAAGMAYRAAHEGEDAQTAALNDSEWAGWATDPLTQANMQQAIADGADTGYSADQETISLMTRGAAKQMSAEEKLSAAKYGTGAAGSFALEALSTGLEVLGDQLLGTLTFGGAGMAAMMARSFGAKGTEVLMQRAQAEGKSLETYLKDGGSVTLAAQQGVASALTEYASEKLGGTFGRAYGLTLGRTAAGRKLSAEMTKATGKFFKSTGAKIFGRWMMKSAEEGFEEPLGNVMSSVIDRVMGWETPEDAAKTLTQKLWDERGENMYEALLGATVGMFGATAELATGAIAAEVEQDAQLAEEAKTWKELNAETWDERTMEMYAGWLPRLQFIARNPNSTEVRMNIEQGIEAAIIARALKGNKGGELTEQEIMDVLKARADMGSVLSGISYNALTELQKEEKGSREEVKQDTTKPAQTEEPKRPKTTQPNGDELKKTGKTLYQQALEQTEEAQNTAESPETDALRRAIEEQRAYREQQEAEGVTLQSEQTETTQKSGTEAKTTTEQEQESSERSNNTENAAAQQTQAQTAEAQGLQLPKAEQGATQEQAATQNATTEQVATGTPQELQLPTAGQNAATEQTATQTTQTAQSAGTGTTDTTTAQSAGTGTTGATTTPAAPKYEGKTGTPTTVAERENAEYAKHTGSDATKLPEQTLKAIADGKIPGVPGVGQAEARAELQRRSAEGVNNGRTETAAGTAGTATTELAGRGDDLADGRQRGEHGEREGGSAGQLGSERKADAGRRGTGGQNDKARNRQDAAEKAGLTEVSTASFGIKGGSTKATVKVFPRNMWDIEMKTVAAKIEAETGQEVVFIVGPLIAANGGGTAKGVNTPTQIIIQCDNPHFSVTQIADHEKVHSFAREGNDPGLLTTIIEALEEKLGAAGLKQMCDAYKEKYLGPFMRSLGSRARTMSEGELAEAWIRYAAEEIAADANAGINFNRSGSNAMQETVRAVLRERGHLDNGTKRMNASESERAAAEQNQPTQQQIRGSPERAKAEKAAEKKPKNTGRSGKITNEGTKQIGTKIMDYAGFRSYSSVDNPVTITEMRQMIKDFTDWINEQGKDAYGGTEIVDRAVEIAQVLHENAWTEEDEGGNQYKKEVRDRTRDIIKDRTLKISAENWHDLGMTNADRMSNYGNMRLSYRGGEPIDIVYQQLQAALPGFYDDNYPSQQDMVDMIYEALHPELKMVNTHLQQSVDAQEADLYDTAEKLINMAYAAAENQKFSMDEERQQLQQAIQDETGIDVTKLENKNRFSMDEPVEMAREMIGVHCIDTDLFFMSMDKYGGLAGVSYAIVPAENGDDANAGFGDMSVFLTKEAATPGEDVLAWTRDAWTPTFRNVILGQGKDPAKQAEWEIESALWSGELEGPTGSIVISRGMTKDADRKRLELAYAEEIANGGDGNLIEVSEDGVSSLIDRLLGMFEDSELRAYGIMLEKGYMSAEGVWQDETLQQKMQEDESFELLLDAMYSQDAEKFNALAEAFIKSKELLDGLEGYYKKYEDKVEQTLEEYENSKDQVKAENGKNFGKANAESISKAMREAGTKGVQKPWNGNWDEFNLSDATVEDLQVQATQQLSGLEEARSKLGKIENLEYEEYRKREQFADMLLKWLKYHMSIESKPGMIAIEDWAGRYAPYSYFTEYDEDFSKMAQLFDADKSDDENFDAIRAATTDTHYSDQVIYGIVDLMRTVTDIPVMYFEGKRFTGTYANDMAGIAFPESKLTDERRQKLDDWGIKYQTYNTREERKEAGNRVAARFSMDDSEGNELSQEQQEFFSESKIRDEDGKLLVVYHGTDADFTVFDRTKGRTNMDINGHFFSPWEIDAEGYGSNVNAYYLNITNPAPEGVAYKALNRFKGQNGAGIKAREYLQRLGYDGVNNGGEEFIAFESEQIKRVDNRKPTKDQDVRFSMDEFSEEEKQTGRRSLREDGFAVVDIELNTTTSIDTSEENHTAEENRTIAEYIHSVDEKLKEFYINAVKEGPGAKTAFEMKNVTDKDAEEILKITGKDVKGFKTEFLAKQAWHTYDRHGPFGKENTTMRNPNDVARTQYIIDNHDVICDGGTSSAFIEPKDKDHVKKAKTVIYAKKLDHTFCAVLAVPVTNRKTVEIVTEFTFKEGVTPKTKFAREVAEKIKAARSERSQDAFAPRRTADTEFVNNLAADDIVAGNSEKSNRVGTEENDSQRFSMFDDQTSLFDEDEGYSSQGSMFDGNGAYGSEDLSQRQTYRQQYQQMSEDELTTAIYDILHEGMGLQWQGETFTEEEIREKLRVMKPYEYSDPLEYRRMHGMDQLDLIKELEYVRDSKGADRDEVNKLIYQMLTRAGTKLQIFIAGNKNQEAFDEDFTDWLEENGLRKDWMHTRPKYFVKSKMGTWYRNAETYNDYTYEYTRRQIDEMDKEEGPPRFSMEKETPEEADERRARGEYKSEAERMFYENIEEASANLNVEEDREARAKLLELAKKQILANREKRNAELGLPEAEQTEQKDERGTGGLPYAKIDAEIQRIMKSQKPMERAKDFRERVLADVKRFLSSNNMLKYGEEIVHGRRNNLLIRDANGIAKPLMDVMQLRASDAKVGAEPEIEPKPLQMPTAEPEAPKPEAPKQRTLPVPSSRMDKQARPDEIFDTPDVAQDPAYRADYDIEERVAEEREEQRQAEWEQRQNESLEDFLDRRAKEEAEARQRREQARRERVRGNDRDEFYGTDHLQKVGVKVAGSVGAYGQVAGKLAARRAANSIKKEVRKAEKRLHATPQEKDFAAKVASGFYDIEQTPKGLRQFVVEQLSEYYSALQAVSDDILNAQKRQISRDLEEKMDGILKDLPVKKKPSAINLSFNTPARIMRQMFGEKGEAVYRAIFLPVEQNEAERMRWQNRMYDRARTFEDQNGKKRKLSRKERALTQRLIEGRAAAAMVAGMEMKEAVKAAAEAARKGDVTAIQDMAMDAAPNSPATREQLMEAAQGYAKWLDVLDEMEKSDGTIVMHAADELTAIYNDLYDAINDFLIAHGYDPIGYIKGYSPHLQPKDEKLKLDRAFQALGLGSATAELPTEIAGLTASYRPNKQWNPFFQTRYGENAQIDAILGFESYINYMSNVLYHTDDIMRVRAMSTWFRKNFADEMVREKIDEAWEARHNGTLEQKLSILREAGKIGPAEMITEDRCDEILERYLESLYDPDTKTTHNTLTPWLDNYANILAGKQSIADRGAEQTFGRKSLNVANKLIAWFSTAQVGGKFSSALNQTAQLPIIYAELGGKYFLYGLKDSAFGNLRKGGWAETSDFLTGKNGVDYIVTDIPGMLMNTLFAPAGFMDSMLSTIAVRGAYMRALNDGKSEKEAMQLADRFGQEIMGSRAKGTKPVIFESKNPIIRMLTVFQVEALNTWEHVARDLPRDFHEIERTKGRPAAAAALAGVIVKAIIAAFVHNRLSDELYGGSPAPFDIIGLTSTFIASGQGLTTNDYIRALINDGMEALGQEDIFDVDDSTLSDGAFDLESAMDDTMYNLGMEIPLARNAMGLLGLTDGTLPMAGLSSVADIKENVKALYDGVDEGDVRNLALSGLGMLQEFVPGGSQMKKTINGAQIIKNQGKMAKNGNVQYTYDFTPGDIARLLLFGPSATPQSSRYYASGGKTMTTTQQKTYDIFTGLGMGNEEAAAMIRRDWKAAQDVTEQLGGKGITQAGAKEYLDTTDYSTDMKAMLWHLMSGARAAKNNPYNPKVSEEIMEYTESGELGGLKLPAY